MDCNKTGNRPNMDRNGHELKSTQLSVLENELTEIDSQFCLRRGVIIVEELSLG